MVDDPLTPRRRVERYLLTLDTVAKGSNGLAQPMTLLNLSPLGFRARGRSVLAPGDHFRLELPRLSDAVAKVVWSSGEEFGGQFPTYLPLSEAADSMRPLSSQYGLRIEYGPPGDRRIVDCPTAHEAAEWYDEIVAAGLPFVRILTAQGDIVSADYLRNNIAG
jgi:hypothetical protein